MARPRSKTSRAARVCPRQECINLVYGRGSLCNEHARQARQRRDARNVRPSSTERGYGREWQEIRKEVLRAHGIPPNQWPKYQVDHQPRYNPAIEPNHRAYNLVPMLRENHSRKTAMEDGGFGHQKKDNE